MPNPSAPGRETTTLLSLSLSLSTVLTPLLRLSFALSPGDIMCNIMFNLNVVQLVKKSSAVLTTLSMPSWCP